MDDNISSTNKKFNPSKNKGSSFIIAAYNNIYSSSSLEFKSQLNPWKLNMNLNLKSIKMKQTGASNIGSNENQNTLINNRYNQLNNKEEINLPIIKKKGRYEYTYTQPNRNFEPSKNTKTDKKDSIKQKPKIYLSTDCKIEEPQVSPEIEILLGSSILPNVSINKEPPIRKIIVRKTTPISITESLKTNSQHQSPSLPIKIKRNWWKLIKEFTYIQDYYRFAIIYKNDSKLISNKIEGKTLAFHQNITILRDWILMITDPFWDELNCYQNYQITLKEYLPQKRVKVESQKIIDIINLFMKFLFKNTSRLFDIPEKIQSILTEFIQDHNYYPKKYLSTFQVNRLDFDIYGATKKLTESQMGMIIAFLLINSISIQIVFLHSSDLFCEFAKYPNINYAAKYIGSIIHYMTRDAFENNPKIHHDVNCLRNYYRNYHQYHEQTDKEGNYINTNMMFIDPDEYSQFLIPEDQMTQFWCLNSIFIQTFKDNVFQWACNFGKSLKMKCDNNEAQVPLLSLKKKERPADKTIFRGEYGNIISKREKGNWWKLAQDFVIMYRYYSVANKYTQFAKIRDSLIQKRTLSIAQDMTELKKWLISIQGSFWNTFNSSDLNLSFTNKNSQAKILNITLQIISIINKYVENLIMKSSALNDIPEKIQLILYDFIRDKGYQPINYYPAFQLNRLDFNLDGGTKDMREVQVGMIIATLLINNITVQQILLQFKDVFEKYKDYPFINITTKYLGSILHYLTRETFQDEASRLKELLPFINYYRSYHVYNEEVKNADDILSKDFSLPDVDDYALNLISKENIITFWNTNSSFVDSYKSLIYSWSCKMGQRIKSKYAPSDPYLLSRRKLQRPKDKIFNPNAKIESIKKKTDEKKNWWRLAKNAVHIHIGFSIMLKYSRYAKIRNEKIEERGTSFIKDITTITEWMIKIQKHFWTKFKYAEDIDYYDTAHMIKIKHESEKIKAFIVKYTNRIMGNTLQLDKIPHNIQEILYSFIKNKGYYPIGYLTTFQANRLDYDFNGSTKLLSESQVGMLLAYLIINLICIKLIFLHIKEHIPDYNKLPNIEKSAKFLGSILYYMIRDAFAENLPLNNDLLAMLNYTRNYHIIDSQEEGGRKLTENDDMINSLYDENEFVEFWEMNKDFVTNYKRCIYSWACDFGTMIKSTYVPYDNDLLPKGKRDRPKDKKFIKEVPKDNNQANLQKQDNVKI